jgi:hypothetical protein
MTFSTLFTLYVLVPSNLLRPSFSGSHDLCSSFRARKDQVTHAYKTTGTIVGVFLPVVAREKHE